MHNVSKQLSRVLNLLREPMFILDAQQLCVFANDSLIKLLDLDSTRSPKVEEFWPKLNLAHLKAGHCSTEFCLSSGEVFKARIAVDWLDQGYCVVRVTAGSALSQAQVNFQSQRLETLGLLASGIAHDFNNVLAGILGHVTYLKTILPANGPHVDSIKSIEEGARKSSSMTQQILSFSKSDSVERVTKVNLGDLVTRTVKLLKGAISYQFRLESSVPDLPVQILAEESRIAQVLVNLVINARDALDSSGEIRVELGLEQDAQKLCAVFKGADLSCPKYAVLEVSDNGHGMSAEVLERVFEPYFSTKSDKGTGLGLYTVDSIVKFYGGAIQIESSLKKGTSVKVYLPALDEVPSKEAVKPKALTPLVGGQESILIVDDEYPVRNVLSVSLRHLGYQVETAGSGQEALDKFKAQAGGFDLVILDMLMPTLSGAEVFECLREINPQTRVLLISGYASMDLIKSVLKKGGAGFMQKPFTIDDLSRKVRECFAPKAAK